MASYRVLLCKFLKMFRYIDNQFCVRIVTTYGGYINIYMCKKKRETDLKGTRPDFLSWIIYRGKYLESVSFPVTKPPPPPRCITIGVAVVTAVPGANRLWNPQPPNHISPLGSAHKVRQHVPRHIQGPVAKYWCNGVCWVVYNILTLADIRTCVQGPED